MISYMKDTSSRRIVYKWPHATGVTPSALNTCHHKKEQRMHGGVYMYTTREFQDEE